MLPRSLMPRLASLAFAGASVAAASAVAVTAVALTAATGPASAQTKTAASPATPAPDAPFRAIEGGDLSLADYRGGPVLLVNTASMCGFTYQYEGLQALWEEYREAGLTVLAVPSDAFNQEYAEADKVKEFCEVNFSITLPMTDITSVRGPDAHPVYQWLKAEHGFTPRWNFNKVLLAADGRFVEAWGSGARPDGGEITRAVKATLAQAS